MYITNYEILENISKAGRLCTYRGRKIGEKDTIVAKILDKSQLSSSEILMIKQDVELIKNIHTDSLIQIYDIVENNGTFCLIEEDFNGVPINRHFVKEVNVESFLKIAVKLAEVLGNLHQKNIVHKNLNPNNILINKQGSVKIANFGALKLLMDENDGSQERNAKTKPFIYISPEQTGRIYGKVDYRTDFYSLGVILYEVLVGIPPFKSDDPMEIVHSHIAVKPIPPLLHNPRIPEVLSDIIMKLLAKTPEERYQNAFGLMFDLQKCLSRLNQNGITPPFSLAKKDVSNQFQVPRKLFGRERLLAELLSIFKSASRGTVELMIVKGAPGIGKTFLINEMDKPVTIQHGYFISGKFEKNKQDIPYSAIIQAFQTLIRRILSENSKKIEIWKENIMAALGVNGKVITDIFPDVELIIGKQPKLPELASKESMNRFNFVIENFISVFTQFDHPIVIFLDDLQWADVASLNLIKNLITRTTIKYFYIIGAYRDGDVDSRHPLIDTLKTLEENKFNYHTVMVGPLQESDVEAYIIESLKCDTEKATPLAQLVYQKTGGNPFFMIQLLSLLYTAKCFEFDMKKGWRWDIGRIASIPVTDNIVELLVRKINNLPEHVSELLKICACMGNRFDLESLSFIHCQPLDATLNDINDAVNEGFIVKSGNNGDTPNSYQFHHDRIQEALYSLIPDKEKITIHHRIGRFELEDVKKGESQNSFFHALDQLNLGYDLSFSENEKMELCQLNFEAGKKAKESAAYSQAFSYLEKAIALLENNSWVENYHRTMAIYTEAVKVACLKGDFEQMNELAETALEKAKSTLDKVNIYKSKIEACIAQEKVNDALENGKYIIKFLGYNKKATKWNILKEFILCKLALRGKDFEAISSLPEMTDPVLLSVLEMADSLGFVLYNMDPELFVLNVFKIIQLSLRHGFSPEHPNSYITYGAALSSIFGDIEGGYKFGSIGVKLVERESAKKHRCKATYLFNQLIRHWKEPLRNSLSDYLECYQYGLDSGDLTYAAMCLNMHSIYSYNAGVPLQTLEKDVERKYKLIEDINQFHILTWQKIHWQAILNLVGKSDNPTKLIGDVLNEEKEIPIWIAENNRITLAIFYSTRLGIRSFFHDYPSALSDSEELEKYLDSTSGSIVIRNLTYYDSINRLALFPHLSRLQKRKYLRKILRNKKLLKKWANHAPANNLHRLYLIEAEHARVTGKNSRAEKFYDMAIESSREYEYFQEEAFANELAGRYYLSIERKKVAKIYMNDAYKCYRNWGAVAKLKHLEALHPELLSKDAKDSITSIGALIDANPALKGLDLYTVTKASQTISGEIVLEKLLNKMMRIIIENAGAEKGFIILKNNEDLFIEAEGFVGNEEIAVLQSIPLYKHKGISSSIVNYVSHTKETVLLNNAASEGDFTNDPYVVSNKPKSILCSAILNSGKLSGILYLENNLSIGAFTPERLLVLQMLSSQIAISIDNAKFYETLEEKVRERTQELKLEINKRKNTENELRLSYQRLVKVLDCADEAIIVVNQMYDIVFFNKGAENLLLYSVNEVLNQSIKILLPDKSMEILKTHAGLLTNSLLLDIQNQIVMNIQQSTGDEIDANVSISAFLIQKEPFYSIIFRRLPRIADSGIPAKNIPSTMAEASTPSAPDLSIYEKVDSMANNFKEKFLTLENALKDIGSYINTQNTQNFQEENLRKFTTDIMQLSLKIWETSTGKTRIELAEESRIWKAYCDQATWRTRTFDKYLKLSTLPKKPRYPDVLKTADFVLSNCNQDTEDTRTLKEMMAYLKDAEQCSA